MNKYLKTCIFGIALTTLGVLWEIGDTYPDILKNVIISIVFPPTYRLFEIVGLALIIYGIWYNLKCTKEEMESK